MSKQIHEAALAELANATEPKDSLDLKIEALRKVNRALKTLPTNDRQWVLKHFVEEIGGA